MCPFLSKILIKGNVYEFHTDNYMVRYQLTQRLGLCRVLAFTVVKKYNEVEKVAVLVNRRILS